MNTINQEKVEILKEFLQCFEQFVQKEKSNIYPNYSLCKINNNLLSWDKFDVIRSIILANEPKRFPTEFKSTNAYFLGYYWPIDQIEPRKRWIKRMIKKYSKD